MKQEDIDKITGEIANTAMSLDAVLQKGQYLVWWLSQHEIEDIVVATAKLKRLEMPEYMLSEFESMWGRAGRGRLWVPVDIPVADIGTPDNITMSILTKNRAGMVFHARDVRYVAGLPGIVTDISYRPVSYLED